MSISGRAATGEAVHSLRDPRYVRLNHLTDQRSPGGHSPSRSTPTFGRSALDKAARRMMSSPAIRGGKCLSGPAMTSCTTPLPPRKSGDPSRRRQQALQVRACHASPSTRRQERGGAVLHRLMPAPMMTSRTIYCAPLFSMPSDVSDTSHFRLSEQHIPGIEG